MGGVDWDLSVITSSLARGNWVCDSLTFVN